MYIYILNPAVPWARRIDVDGDVTRLACKGGKKTFDFANEIRIIDDHGDEDDQDRLLLNACTARLFIDRRRGYRRPAWRRCGDGGGVASGRVYSIRYDDNDGRNTV